MSVSDTQEKLWVPQEEKQCIICQALLLCSCTRIEREKAREIGAPDVCKVQRCSHTRLVIHVVHPPVRKQSQSTVAASSCIYDCRICMFTAQTNHILQEQSLHVCMYTPEDGRIRLQATFAATTPDNNKIHTQSPHTMNKCSVNTSDGW